MIASSLRIGAVLGSTCLALAGLVGPAWAQDQSDAKGPAGTGLLRIELNKLEPQGDACRAYLVFENGTGMPVESLKLDLFTFDGDGVINRRLAVEGGPVATGKIIVKLFDLSDMACNDIDRVLLNDILACAGENGPIEGCMGKVELSSRTDVPFVK